MPPPWPRNTSIPSSVLMMTSLIPSPLRSALAITEFPALTLAEVNFVHQRCCRQRMALGLSLKGGVGHAPELSVNYGQQSVKSFAIALAPGAEQLCYRRPLRVDHGRHQFGARECLR